VPGVSPAGKQCMAGHRHRPLEGPPGWGSPEAARQGTDLGADASECRSRLSARADAPRHPRISGAVPGDASGPQTGGPKGCFVNGTCAPGPNGRKKATPAFLGEALTTGPGNTHDGRPVSCGAVPCCGSRDAQGRAARDRRAAPAVRRVILIGASDSRPTPSGEPAVRNLSSASWHGVRNPWDDQARSCEHMSARRSLRASFGAHLDGALRRPGESRSAASGRSRCRSGDPAPRR
jgi:hypothetical protein